MPRGKVAKILGDHSTQRDNPSPGLFSVQELRDIIHTCRESGVSSLSFQGLTVSFMHTELDVTHSNPIKLPPLAESTESELADARKRLADRKIGETDAMQMEQLEARDLYLENLKVTDPLEYERHMLEEGQG
jgi:hypothetical protein